MHNNIKHENPASKWSENVNCQLLTVRGIDAIIISNLEFTAFSSLLRTV